MRSFMHGVPPTPQRSRNDSSSHSTRTVLRAKTAVGNAAAIAQRVVNRLWVIAIVMGVFLVVIATLIAFI
jgi:hypothetical protein